MKTLIRFLLPFSFFVSGIALAQGTEKVEPPMTPKHWADLPGAWRFGIGASYSFLSEFNATDATKTNYEKVPSIVVDLRHLGPGSWGVLGSLIYDLERKQILSEDPSKIQVSTVSLTVARRWDEFYFGWGLNYSQVKFTPPASYDGTASARGSTGGQFEAGYYLSEKIAMEVRLMGSVAKIDYQPTGGVPSDSKSGSLSNVALTFKYVFF